MELGVNHRGVLGDSIAKGCLLSKDPGLCVVVRKWPEKGQLLESSRRERTVDAQ